MAYLTKISDLDPALVNADPEQIYLPKALIDHKGYDDNGDTYVQFKIVELCEFLNQSKSTVVSAKKQLAQYGLIEEVKVGSDQPNRIYLTDKLVPYLKE